MGLGIDLSLRHGAMVFGAWDLADEDHTLTSYDRIVIWDKVKTKKARSAGRGKVKEGLQEKSTATDIRILTGEIYKALTRWERQTEIPANLPIAVDWDPLSIFWGRRRAASTLAFFAGYLGRAMENAGHPVVFISPDEVRSRLGMPKKISKEELWVLFPDILKEEEANSDVRDAMILTYLIGVTSGEYEAAGKTGILSRNPKG